jgi:tRNA G46 methylase TrmB
VQAAVNFPERCALLVERTCDALKDFTGEREEPIALDVGCAVGGATFEMSSVGFREVLGLDYSRAFVNAANTMKEHGSMQYVTVIEGSLTVRAVFWYGHGTSQMLSLWGGFRVPDSTKM